MGEPEALVSLAERERGIIGGEGLRRQTQKGRSRGGRLTGQGTCRLSAPLGGSNACGPESPVRVPVADGRQSLTKG